MGMDSILCPKGCAAIVTDESRHRDRKFDSKTKRWIPGYYYRGWYKDAKFPGVAATSHYYNGHYRVGEGICLYNPISTHVQCSGSHRAMKRACACGEGRKDAPPAASGDPEKYDGKTRQTHERKGRVKIPTKANPRNDH